MPPNLKIDIYTSRFNPECIRAKGLLDRTGVDYNEFDVDLDEFHREIMRKRSGGRTSVPRRSEASTGLRATWPALAAAAPAPGPVATPIPARCERPLRG